MSPATPAAPPDRPRADLSRLRIEREENPPPRRGGRAAWLGAAVLAAAAVVYLLTTDVLPFRRPQVEVARTRVTESGGGAAAGGAATGSAVLSASGYVVARVRAAVAPEVTGRLVELDVDVGSRVKRGDLIGRLADADLVAQVKQATAAIASSDAMITEERARRDDLRREADRQKQLFAQGLTSQAARDAAITGADAADARVATAEANLETSRATLGVVQAQLAKTSIRAPFDGTVLEKNAELGEIVGPAFGGSSATGGGVPVVTMADLASVEVEVDVNETYIRRVTPEMRAEIVLDAYPSHAYAGAVRQIVPTADRQKATVRVKVRFDQTDEHVLPEMGARVSFLAAAPAASSGSAARAAQVWVPHDAVRRDTSGTVVWVLRGDRVAVQKVDVGPQVGADVQILAGLGLGERVVVGEAPPARPGQRVRAHEGGTS
ncbi:MAG: efflux RND transporter periplasmic adaptor subunit [bacterium]